MGTAGKNSSCYARPMDEARTDPRFLVRQDAADAGDAEAPHAAVVRRRAVARTSAAHRDDADPQQVLRAAHRARRQGELASWADGPRRRLSLILLLDQFPRNIYRGTSKAFAYDEQALGLALSGMHSGADAALDPVERIFFYLPLQHAESLEVQDESVAAYRRLVGESPEILRPVAFDSCLKYAEMHRDVIRQFGRFPHRNRVLGRLSTPDEQAYLEGGAGAFRPVSPKAAGYSGTPLPKKLVDVKVCAVDETWSGLKLMYRLKDR